MLYSKFLQTMKGCPFCDYKDRALSERKTAYLTYALAPYVSNHLLVIPKRHTAQYLGFSKKENKDISDLLRIGAEILKKAKVKDWTILVREGRKAKSISHLHYHLIPNHRIGDLDIRGRKRKILTPKEVDALLLRLRKLL